MNNTQNVIDLEIAILHGDYPRFLEIIDNDNGLANARFINNLNLTPLMWACRNRRSMMVEKLLAIGASVNDTNAKESNGDGYNTSLWFTAQGALPGAVPIAKMLIENGANVNQICEDGTTAFHAASSWVQIELAYFLYLNGADIHIKDSSGLTAIDSVKKDFAWCTEQEKLAWDQKVFFDRAPKLILFLDKIYESPNESGHRTAK